MALCRCQGGQHPCPWWGVGPHPLTTPHFTAAELATSLGVDEGPLACLHLQVCVVGQALLSLFSVVGGTHSDLQFCGVTHSLHTCHHPLFTTSFLFFFKLKSLLNLLQYCLCCLCPGFLAMGHMGSLLPDQGSNLHPLHWKAKC